MVTCEIKPWNNVKIISKEFYFTCNHGLRMLLFLLFFVFSHSVLTDPTIQQPGFDLPRHTWSLLNSFQTGQGLCPCKSAQMASCPITLLWLWPATDHESHSEILHIRPFQVLVAHLRKLAPNLFCCLAVGRNSIKGSTCQMLRLLQLSSEILSITCLMACARNNFLNLAFSF